jgi:hypothetical protein
MELDTAEVEEIDVQRALDRAWYRSCPPASLDVLDKTEYLTLTVEWEGMALLGQQLRFNAYKLHSTGVVLPAVASHSLDRET